MISLLIGKRIELKLKFLTKSKIKNNNLKKDFKNL